MYEAFYQLTEDPFRLSPDHAFCYRHPSFAKGRAYMQYALNSAEGFVVVTGSPGMGKTTLINDLLSDYGPSQYLVATLVNTLLGASDILRSTAYEFGLEAGGLDKATLLERLKQLFVASRKQGTPPLLIVDEAQNLSLEAMEELRLLTNLQAEGKPLLQIFLVGQDQLREKLQDPRLEQLLQRVTAATHLRPLTEEQTASYMLHRLKVAGWTQDPKIANSAVPVIHSTAQGVPRRINQFCSRLLLFGAVEEKHLLDAEDARTVYHELSEENLSAVAPQPREAMAEGFLGELGGEPGATQESTQGDLAAADPATGAGLADRENPGAESQPAVPEKAAVEKIAGEEAAGGPSEPAPAATTAWSEPGIGFSEPILDPLDQVPLSARSGQEGRRSEPFIGAPGGSPESSPRRGHREQAPGMSGARAGDSLPGQVPPLDLRANQALNRSAPGSLVESLDSVSARANGPGQAAGPNPPEAVAEQPSQGTAEGSAGEQSTGEQETGEQASERHAESPGDLFAILAVIGVVLAGVAGYLYFGIDPELKVKLLELKARALSEWGNLLR